MRRHEIVEVVPPRRLQSDELAVLERLLSTRFGGRDELRRQLGALRVSATCKTCPTVELTTVGDLERAKTHRRIPVEGRARDVDGVPIQILLHVVDGVIASIEVFREDGERISEMPSPNSLDVFS